MLSRMKTKTTLQLLFLISLIIAPSNVNAEDKLVPSSISIRGEIVNNYANITHEIVFDNSGSDLDREVSYAIKIPYGLYLSNVSATMGNHTYWGRVEEIGEAENIYNESVASNMSAILVSSYADYYQFDLNVEGGEVLNLIAFFEGYLTRNRGKYQLNLIKEEYIDSTLDLSIDIQIQSSLASVLSPRIKGVLGEILEEVTDGYRLTYSYLDYFIEKDIIVSYSLATLDTEGKILTYFNGTDNFFVYLLAPEIDEVEQREPREFIFLIDVSGSMNGEKIIQAQDAFSKMIETLSNEDQFNVFTFSTAINSLWDTLKPGDSENVEEALDWVYDLYATGSTDLNEGIVQSLSNFDVESVNAKVLSLLSDGLASYGETDSENIRSNAIKENHAEAMIFSIAFGDDADDELMSALGFDSNGDYIKILPGVNAVDQLYNFYDTFATPVAIDHNITIDGGFDIAPDPSIIGGALFNGSEILITGKYSDALTISTSISYSSGENDMWSNTIADSISSGNQIERIWAVNTINQLLRFSEVNGITDQIDDQITSIALYYGLVVKGYTGLIIVIDDKDESYENRETDAGGIDFVNQDPSPPINEVYGLASFYEFSALVPVFLLIFIMRRRRMKNKETHKAPQY